jgi:hypothetical protein
MIEMVEIFLANILELRIASDPEDAIKEIEKVCLNQVGIPFELVKRSAPEVLYKMLASSGSVLSRSVLLAELFLQYSEINALSGRDDLSVLSKLQAFCLIGDCMDLLSIDDRKVYQQKLSMLSKSLESLDDPYVREKLIQYTQVDSIRQP